ncbi:MAG TPA: phosphate ABC transporter permease PstA [Hyphomicrobiaceae bacterium]|nr:phosphate ABC transporter permease PstA [Hyphomicrobiaceae bacterium]
MTDTVVAPPATERASTRRLDLTSKEAQARVRRRYLAEWRFKMYGLVALTLTTLFLVVLIADILYRGLPAFWQYSVVLDVPVKAEEIDPDNKRTELARQAAELRSRQRSWLGRWFLGPNDADRAPDPLQPIRAGDYFGLARQALYDAFPGVEGRRERRMLQGLLSTGAADPLRERAAADVGLVGQTVRVPLRLSANADLFLKGESAAIERRNGIGVATPSGTTGDITILTSANDFADFLTLARVELSLRANALRSEADRLERRAGAAQADRVKELRADADALQARVDQVKGEAELDDKMPSQLVAINGGLVKIEKLGDSNVSGRVILPLVSTAEAQPKTWMIVTYLTPESLRRLSDPEVAFLERLRADGRIERGFNWLFFASGDSREPELAGIRGALVGSALTLLVTLLLSLPIGVLAAIYLEEFAPKNRATDLIEININNLAAVPSIVFGLLGLAVFLNFFGLPRSAPLVGGLVLALLVLPTIIIAARAALKAVPPSIKEAALGVGASHQQAVFHHVLPLAMPGIMTGTIIGMAHALGETAPLLMIGMVAFIVDVPQALTDAATVLPVQVYLWSDLPEPAFKAKTAAAIIVLLVFLFIMNGLAIYLRKKFERRW